VLGSVEVRCTWARICHWYLSTPKRLKERAGNVPVSLLRLKLELLKLDQHALERANRFAITLRTLFRANERPIRNLVGRKASDVLRNPDLRASGTWTVLLPLPAS